jgi:hypothetical protein
VFLLFEEYERGEVIDTDEVAQDNRPSTASTLFWRAASRPSRERSEGADQIT